MKRILVPFLLIINFKAIAQIESWQKLDRAVYIAKMDSLNNWVYAQKIQAIKQDSINHFKENYSSDEEISKLNDENKIPAFNLIGLSQEEIIKILKSKGKIYFEKIGRESIEGIKYSTKFGNYDISYRNGVAIKLILLPSVKQVYNEYDLFDGGKFNINYDSPCIGTDEKGKAQNYSFYSIVFDCDNGTHKITFIGKKGSIVTKIIAY